jgi:predicted membrane protein
MENKNNPGKGQVLIGVAVIAFGFLFLLDNLGFLDFGYTLQFWPALFILAGALKFSQSQSSGGKITGVVMMAVGALLVLKGMGLVYISWRNLMPLALIGLGLAVIFKSTHARKPETFINSSGEATTDDSIINVTALLGGVERRITSTGFRGGEVTAIMGGCELDLRHASIQGEAVLNVFAMWGGIEIKVPEDWVVSMQGTPILGGFSEKTMVSKDASMRLVIRGYAIMGGVEVRN